MRKLCPKTECPSNILNNAICHCLKCYSSKCYERHIMFDFMQAVWEWLKPNGLHEIPFLVGIPISKMTCTETSLLNCRTVVTVAIKKKGVRATFYRSNLSHSNFCKGTAGRTIILAENAKNSGLFQFSCFMHSTLSLCRNVNSVI